VGHDLFANLEVLVAKRVLRLRRAGHRVLPVVAMGASELLDGGRYGILYEAGNVEELTAAIGRVLDESPGVGVSRRCRLRRAEDFEESKILPRLEAYYCDGRSVARNHIMTA
jgi:hypothetical protein